MTKRNALTGRMPSSPEMQYIFTTGDKDAVPLSADGRRFFPIADWSEVELRQLAAKTEAEHTAFENQMCGSVACIHCWLIHDNFWSNCVGCGTALHDDPCDDWFEI